MLYLRVISISATTTVLLNGRIQSPALALHARQDNNAPRWNQPALRESPEVGPSRPVLTREPWNRHFPLASWEASSNLGSAYSQRLADHSAAVYNRAARCAVGADRPTRWWPASGEPVPLQSFLGDSTSVQPHDSIGKFSAQLFRHYLERLRSKRRNLLCWWRVDSPAKVSNANFRAMHSSISGGRKGLRTTCLPPAPRTQALSSSIPRRGDASRCGRATGPPCRTAHVNANFRGTAVCQGSLGKEGAN